MSRPDPRPPARVRNPVLLKILHVEWRECALCGATGPRLSLHHLRKHPRDDVRPNLVMLCGDGVHGCHGDVEAGDRAKRLDLGTYLLAHRPDAVDFLGLPWIRRTLYADA